MHQTVIKEFLNSYKKPNFLHAFRLAQDQMRTPDELPISVYLSSYLKQHQTEYYRRLSAIRTEGDWESWITFFLEGITVASADAENGIVTIASLVSSDRRRLMDSAAGAASYRLFEQLPMMPRFTVERVRQLLGSSFPTANAAVKVLEEVGIVSETTGQKQIGNTAMLGILRHCRLSLI